MDRSTLRSLLAWTNFTGFFISDIFYLLSVRYRTSHIAVGSEVQHQVFGQGSRAVLPALGQLLHLFAELGERFDRELRIVSLQDIVVAVGIDEFEDRLALGIDHPLRLFRHEDLGYWGVTDVFRPDVVSTRIGFIFKGIQP